MNMISTGAFQTEMDASNKQTTLAEKFVGVWEKKNAKAARAGGVSLMALSLAACGSDDTTTATTTTTTTTTTATTPVVTVDAAKVMKLTVRDDTGSDFTGGSGDDTFDGYSTTATLTNGDSLDGGTGTDTLAAYGLGNATIKPVTTGVEVVELRSAHNSAVVNMASMTDVTSIVNDQSTNTLGLTGVSSGVSLAVKATTAQATNLTVTAVTGAADSLSMSVAGDNGVVTADGIETVTVTAGTTHGASTGASLDGLDSNSLTTVNITATAAIDLGVVTQGAAANKAVTIDGSAAAGGFTVDISDFNGTAAGAASVGNTVTGSAGADTVKIDVADIDKYQTMTMGDGDDTLHVTGEYNDGDTAKADLANMTGFTTLHLMTGTDAKGGGTDALTLDATEGLDWVTKLVAGSDTEHLTKKTPDGFIFEVPASITAHQIITTSHAAGVTDLVLNMKGGSTITDLNLTNVGKLTINSTGTAGTNTLTAITDSTAPKLVATGSAALSISTAALGTKMVDVDASAMTGAIDVLASATATKLVGGSAGDTLTGGAGDDTINGGAGGDTIDAKAGADTIDAGAGDDTVSYEVHATNLETITLGAGADIVQSTTGTAGTIAVTVITDMDFGTATTTVDTLKLSLTMMAGLTTTTAQSDSSDNDTGNGEGTVVHASGTDGATILNADLIVLKNVYASDAAAKTGVSTAGAETITFGGTLDDNDAVLLAYTNGTNSFLAQAVSTGGTTSENFDSVTTIMQLTGVTDLTGLDSNDFSFIT
jgi:hypothetical protein